MRFIKKVVGPDEKLVGICSIHWIYGMKGLLMMLGLMLLGGWLDTSMANLVSGYTISQGTLMIDVIGDVIFWICTAIGIAIFLPYCIMMIATEIGLTDKRIIYKTGLIFVDVKEVDLEEIKAAEVNNGAFGRFFNYGYIKLDARFIRNVSIPAITDPYRFVKAVNEVRSKIKQDSMTVVLEGHGSGADTKVEDHTDAQSTKQPPKLDDERYRALEETPAQAVNSVIQESAENLQEASPKDAAPPKKQPKKKLTGKNPIVFKRKQLKEKIMNSFTDITTHSDV